MPPHLASAPNINYLWAALLVEELVRQGTTFFVVCPGSRSTPLAVAVAENPRAEALVHWDERAAAFVALGWGRATGRPAAVITTSGTAVANLLPAAVEADADGVPLLLLTADRPPELRETGANQAIRQMGLFSTVARWEFDLGPPTADVDPAFVLTTGAAAVEAAVRPPGPVHLNLPFREPLAPVSDGTNVNALLEPLVRWSESTSSVRTPRRYTARPSWSPQEVATIDWRQDYDLFADFMRLGPNLEGIVVCGASGRKGIGRGSEALRLAEALRWPLLPDILSGNRTGSGRGREVAYYDLALGSDQFRARARPRVVIQLGGRPMSKRLVRLIEEARPDLYAVIHPRPNRLDPSHRVTHHLQMDPSFGAGRFLSMLENVPVPVREAIRGPREWVALWEEASRAARRGAWAEATNAGLSEPLVARALSRGARKVSTVVAAASMPVRDLDTYADRDAPSFGVVANRGASGIDGTVATAAGFVRGSDQKTVLLIGDLALLHDLTSLALLRDGPPVVVVCINNDGGGIFHRLPIAQGEGALAPDTFEKMFGTPHGLGFADAARQFGLAYHAPETMPAFEAALDEAVRSGASALIEVRTDREEQALLRRRLEAAAAAAVDAALADLDEA